jgi:endoglucanase
LPQVKLVKKFSYVLLWLLIICGACSSTSGSGSNPEPEVTRETFLDYQPSVAYAENNIPQEQMADKSAYDYFRDEKMRIGWNLGNTLDSYRGGIGDERAWGNPSVNQALMNGVKAAGFDVIRIPVTWMGHIGSSQDHLIAESRLKRVAEVVEMAHNAGLKVIINLHHDGSTPSMNQEDGWLSIRKSSRNRSDYEKITHQFVRVWVQIALYFKNYGDWLMFESMNEIHDGGWCWSPEFKMSPQQQLDIVNEWNQLFSDIVRRSGGNNEKRYLIIPAYCTNPQQTVADTFILPTDASANRQVVTFHYYDPYEFSISAKRTEWGSAADKQKVDNDFAPFKSKYIDNKIPVIIGESGAARQLYSTDSAKEAQVRQTRLDYTGYVFAKAKEYGLVPLYWDNGEITGNGEKFGLFNRNTGQPNMPESDAVIKAMINATK